MSEAFTLPSELSIYTVAELAPAWRGQLAAVPGDTLALDAAGVEQIDAAGVQLLLSLRRAAAARGLPLQWVAASLALTSACAALGVDAALGLSGAAA